MAPKLSLGALQSVGQTCRALRTALHALPQAVWRPAASKLPPWHPVARAADVPGAAATLAAANSALCQGRLSVSSFSQAVQYGEANLLQPDFADALVVVSDPRTGCVRAALPVRQTACTALKLHTCVFRFLMQRHSVELQTKRGVTVCQLGGKRRRPSRLPGRYSFCPGASSYCGRFCVLSQRLDASGAKAALVWSVEAAVPVPVSPGAPDLPSQAAVTWLPGPGARLLCSAFDQAAGTGDISVVLVSDSGVTLRAATPALQGVWQQTIFVDPTGTRAALFSTSGIVVLSTADCGVSRLDPLMNSGISAAGSGNRLHWSPDSTALLVRASAAISGIRYSLIAVARGALQWSWQTEEDLHQRPCSVVHTWSRQGILYAQVCLPAGVSSTRLVFGSPETAEEEGGVEVQAQALLCPTEISAAVSPDHSFLALVAGTAMAPQWTSCNRPFRHDYSLVIVRCSTGQTAAEWPLPLGVRPASISLDWAASGARLLCVLEVVSGTYIGVRTHRMLLCFG